MKLLGERERAFVQDRLASMTEPVLLEVYTTPDCPTCPYLTELAEEIADAVPTVRWAEKEPDEDVPEAPALHVVPLLGGSRPYGVYFYGLPGGYEFPSLLEAIRAVSTSDSGLSPGLRRLLARLDRPLDVKVFVTQSCPYCPRMVQLAQRMAVESPLVTAEMIDAAEFPELADQYRVSGVPLTVVDDTHAVVGAVPEARFQQFLEDLIQ
jgi:glutaredoxin-like protein